MNKIFNLCIIGAVILISPLAVQAQDVQEDEMLLAMYFDMDQHLDQKVEVATRAPKSLRQIAENVTVVTAEEIQRMNARSVGEVLNRVPGVFVQFGGRDFNSGNDFSIQDSDYHHVLVLVDGMRWNFDTEGMAVTNSIPVEIIDRIEVIKGPASSTWGSALGGVVNIITKNTGSSVRPHGSLYASYGEANSQHYSGTVSGKAGATGYFLAVANQSSDGIILGRAYDDESVYGKIDIALPHATTLTLTSGHSNPKDDLGDIFGYSMYHRDFWATASLDSSLSQNVSLHISGFRKKQEFMYPPYTMYYDATTTGVASRLTASLKDHLLTVGAEIDRVDTESSDSAYEGHEETWGLFANDTFTVGDFSITPGIRYDHLSLTDNQLSPSLGVTWQYTDRNLFRAQIARGFRKPYLDEASPILDPEISTSYQAGLETTAIPYLFIKIDLFEHIIKDAWDIWAEPVANTGKIKRYGYELELETVPFHYFSADASFTYIYTDYHGAQDNDDMYTAKLTLLYDNPKLFTAELFGQYIWWNDEKTYIEYGYPYDDGTMIWNFNISKNIQLCEHADMDIFASAHNLFNGSHNWSTDYPNAHRWVEAGLRFHF